MPEGTTRTVSFMLTNPPASEDGFGFEFTVVLATEDGEAIGESIYIYIYIYIYNFVCLYTAIQFLELDF